MTIGAVRWFDVPKGYGFIGPTTVALTCWSTYAPSNAQEWPAWIKASDLASKSCATRGSADRTRGNLGVSGLQARH